MSVICGLANSPKRDAILLRINDGVSLEGRAEQCRRGHHSDIFGAKDRRCAPATADRRI